MDMPATTFVPRERLAYDRLLTPPAPGEPFLMDEGYRLCHLPLVNPAHPRAIASVPGKDYRNGRHGRVHSLVAPVPDAALAASPAFLELTRALEGSSFAAKIAWDVAARRAGKLHATLAGSLGAGETPPVPDIAALAAIGPFQLRLEGLFSGNVNRGRLYLEAHPEERAGDNVVHLIQRALGRPPTDLYVIGLHNLTDDLSVAEAAELAALIASWRGRAVAEIVVRELWLLSSTDDLVLDSRVERRIPLSFP
jgi:hypothetical protein